MSPLLQAFIWQRESREREKLRGGEEERQRRKERGEERGRKGREEGKEVGRKVERREGEGRGRRGGGAICRHDSVGHTTLVQPGG